MSDTDDTSGASRRGPVRAMVAVVSVLALVLVALVVVLATRGGDDTGEPEAADGGSTPSGAVDPSVTEAPTSALQSFYSQSIGWSACSGDDGDAGLDCATLTVPVDYDDPTGDTIDLNLQRRPATGDSIGSLVVNPGGPGAPGTSMTESADLFFGEPLLDSLDIVAFDPRGTGESDPVDCLSDADLDAYIAQDPTPDTPAEIREFASEGERFFAGCVDNSDELVGHVSTVEAARDMDVLRAALGEARLRYLGFSYGTTLGSTYAQLFPEEVGPFVLDGAVDPTLDFRENALSQAGGFETAITAYVQSCLDDAPCFLGDTVEAAKATITDLFAAVEEQPLTTQTGRDLEIGNAVYGVVAPLYNQDNWTYLDQGLQAALDGDGTVLQLLSDSYTSRSPVGNGYTDNSFEAFPAISCLDDPASIPAADVPDEFPAFEKVSPTFGDFFAWGLAGCDGIRVEASEPSPTITAEGAAPIVVIGTTRDPATPYEEAVALADQLDSGVLVSRDGDGHTGYNKGNACVDDAVEGYLIDGDVPDDGLEC